jgi:hypothetical protein
MEYNCRLRKDIFFYRQIRDHLWALPDYIKHIRDTFFGMKLLELEEDHWLFIMTNLFKPTWSYAYIF